jgi:hypothetical protein
MHFDPTIPFKYWDALLIGLGTSLRLTLICLAIGIALGFVTSQARRSRLMPVRAVAIFYVERLCCRTRTTKDSHHESMRLDGLHEQAQSHPLPRDQLVCLQHRPSQSWLFADLARQGDGLARAA